MKHISLVSAVLLCYFTFSFSKERPYSQYPESIIGTWLSEVGFSYTFCDNDTMWLSQIGSESAGTPLPYRLRRSTLTIGTHGQDVKEIVIIGDTLSFPTYRIYRQRESEYEPLVVQTEMRELHNNLAYIYSSQRAAFNETGEYLTASTPEDFLQLQVTLDGSEPFTYSVELTDEGFIIRATLHRPVGIAEIGESVSLTNTGPRSYEGDQIKNMVRRNTY